MLVCGFLKGFSKIFGLVEINVFAFRSILVKFSDLLACKFKHLCVRLEFPSVM